MITWIGWNSPRNWKVSPRLDRAALRAALRALIDQSGYTESRFRITIPREQPDHLILSIEPFKPVPAEIIENGARAITLHLERQNAVGHFPQGIYEGILVGSDGALLEGTSSNFYAIKEVLLQPALPRERHSSLRTT
jgi:branched-subunit amino acid aminotransferase/4-amino-4-deoxychorismate lyase